MLKIDDIHKLVAMAEQEIKEIRVTNTNPELEDIQTKLADVKLHLVLINMQGNNRGRNE